MMESERERKKEEEEVMTSLYISYISDQDKFKDR
jgi:hypothetical protein